MSLHIIGVVEASGSTMAWNVTSHLIDSRTLTNEAEIKMKRGF